MSDFENEMPLDQLHNMDVDAQKDSIVESTEPSITETVTTSDTNCCEKKKKHHCCWGRCIFDCLIVAAVIVLFILHFCCPPKNNDNNIKWELPSEVVPGTGEVLFINIDSINENYLFIKRMQKEFDEEMQKQDAIFKQKQANFQKKYEQFQKNYQAGILTEVQIQNTQSQLQAEYQRLEDDYNAVVNHLTSKQYAANQQMLDSVQNVAARINLGTGRNASYVLSYQKDMPLILYADPAKDITQQVLIELNKSQQKEDE